MSFLALVVLAGLVVVCALAFPRLLTTYADVCSATFSAIAGGIRVANGP